MLISADCVSLTMRNSALPFVDGAGRDAEALGGLLLREPQRAALLPYYLVYAHVITPSSGYHSRACGTIAADSKCAREK